MQAARSILHAGFFVGLHFGPELRTGAIISSEISVGFQRTTWRYIPEDRTVRVFNNSDGF
jgi:hypothetical protein